MLGIATVLVMTDLTRHILNDTWGTQCESLQKEAPFAVPGLPGGAQYTKACYGVPFLNEFNEDGSLSTVGWVSSVFCTWIGFILLFISIFWGIDFHRKLKRQWTNMRNRRRNNNAGVVGPATGARDQPLLNTA